MLTARKAVIKAPQTAGPTLAEAVSLSKVKCFSSVRNSASDSKFSWILCYIRGCGSSAGCCCRAQGCESTPHPSVWPRDSSVPPCSSGWRRWLWDRDAELLLLPRASQAAPQTAATSQAAGKAGQGTQPALLVHLRSLCWQEQLRRPYCSLKGRKRGMCCILRSDCRVRDGFAWWNASPAHMTKNSCLQEAKKEPNRIDPNSHP